MSQMEAKPHVPFCPLFLRCFSTIFSAHYSMPLFFSLLFVSVGSQHFSPASLAVTKIPSFLFPIVTPYHLHCSEILLIPLLCSQIMFCRALDCFFFPLRFFSKSLCFPGCLAASPLVGTSCSQVSILPLWHWDCMNGSGIKSLRL